MGQEDLIDIYSRLAVLESSSKSNGEKLDNVDKKIDKLILSFNKVDGIKTGIVFAISTIGLIITAKVSGALTWLVAILTTKV